MLKVISEADCQDAEEFHRLLVQDYRKIGVRSEHLEPIHIFALANLLNRPIIVYGTVSITVSDTPNNPDNNSDNPISEGSEDKSRERGDRDINNYIRGIYLPLISQPFQDDRSNNPEYSNNLNELTPEQRLLELLNNPRVTLIILITL